MSAHQISLVTGGRRGIGRVVAQALGYSGFDVALVDLTLSDELESAAEEVAPTAVRTVALIS